jgi:toxin-antitoxin system PIN domain toxin
MILPDVNVLINAFRTDAPDHELCRHWLVDVVQGEARFGLSPLALAAVARITTHAKIFRGPAPMPEVFAFCDNLLGQPHCQIIEPAERHWDIFRELCVNARVRGGRVTDAWYAALAIEWDCEWITLDRDFGRFAGLKWRRPTA